VLYVGWEGVGLCSYLLIGFFYRDPASVSAAMKAFVITRIGDVFMIIGLLVLYARFGTLDIQPMLQLAAQQEEVGSAAVSLAALLLLGGAVGKSAQLPLQTWLVDAMAGPTPVSALIHAATMVAAGVYLIARLSGLYVLAPQVLEWVGVTGAITLLLAGFSALVQTDIKRVLAYSTMSQIGYMFLALGMGAWGAAIFHLMTHAFFKALLFLSAGAVIIACHHEQDIFKMGGLRRQLPFVYLCFLVGLAALVALPVVTAGFYSKEEILGDALASSHDGLLAAGLVGSFLTALYSFRLLFVVFHGESRGRVHGGRGYAYALPLAVLLLLSTALGGHIHPPLSGLWPVVEPTASPVLQLRLQLLSGVIILSGIALAALLFLGQRRLLQALGASTLGRLLGQLWLHAWGFDWLYEQVFVRPYQWIERLLRGDLANFIVALVIRIVRLGQEAVSHTQNGRLRWYAASIVGGTAVLMWLAIV
jgi:NADH-quinone oxidoreductase subunit L